MRYFYVAIFSLGLFALFSYSYITRSIHVGDLGRTALVVKSIETPKEEALTASILFLVMNPNFIRPQGLIERVAILNIKKGKIERFEVSDAASFDGMLTHTLPPPSELLPLTSNFNFSVANWFRDKNYSDTLLAGLYETNFGLPAQAGESLDTIVTIKNKEFDELYSAPYLKRVQSILDTANTPRDPPVGGFVSYDMTYPPEENALYESVEEKTVIEKNGKTVKTLAVTQSGMSEFVNFLRIYMPKGTELLSFEGEIKNIKGMPTVNNIYGVSIYDEGEYTVFGKYLNITTTEKTFMYTFTLQP